MGYDFPSVQQEGWDLDEKLINCVDDKQELCFKYAVTYNKDSKTRGP